MMVHMQTYTEDEAWSEIQHCSLMICAYVVSRYKLGCDSLFGCTAGARCDTGDHLSNLWERLIEARLVVSQ